MHDPDAVRLALNGAGGLLVVLLGAWVARLRPRTAASTAFAVFSVGFGASFIGNNWFPLLHSPATPRRVFEIVAYAAWLGGLMGLALFFPRPLPARQRWTLAVAAIPLVVYSLLAFASQDWSGGAVRAARFVLTWPAFGGLLSMLVILPLRFAVEEDATARRQLALSAAGLLCFVAPAAAWGLGDSPLAVPLEPMSQEWAYLFLVLASGLVWLGATRGGDARIARNLALLTFALPLYGFVRHMEWVWGNSGVNRTLMVLVLGYAILRYQLLGMDVKVRWAISKSTVAGVFVAVFFVASELAQQVFGATFGGAYAGIVAAGALVFALAPLQRAAERLAERAVPTQAPGSVPARAGSPPRKEEVYRDALRFALRDRAVSRAEELHLFRLADELGISAGRAMELRHEVEEALST